MNKQRLLFLKGNWFFIIFLNVFLLTCLYLLQQFLKKVYFQRVSLSLEQELNQEENLQKVINNKKYFRLFENKENLLKIIATFDSLLVQNDFKQLEKNLNELAPPLIPIFGKLKSRFNLEKLEKKDAVSNEEKKMLRSILKEMISEQVI